MPAPLSWCTLGLILLAGCSAVARQGAGSPAAASDVAARIRALDQRWMSAYTTHDSAAIREIFLPEARMSHANGRTSGTEDEVRAVMDRSLPPGVAGNRWLPDSTVVHVQGAAAVSWGRYLNQGTYQGEPFTRIFRYTNTYVRRNRRWRLLATHFSRVPAD